ncbi:hypothetical protein OPIT5_27855 [Opitutaceae bacterium TAV5]|nr:hypothetical protein OPIT5_27855 [Opitutaceae bacterium TAV5]
MKERSGSSASPGIPPHASARHPGVILPAVVASAALAFFPPVITAATPATAAATPAATPAVAEAPVVLPPPLPTIWETPLPADDTNNAPASATQAEWDAAVEALVSTFEQATGRKLVPGEKRKAGLKIYTESGPGLSTPLPLTRAVIRALERRGFASGDIFLVGLNPIRLRTTGYLPLSATDTAPFEGHPVYVLESKRFYDPVWFYDSPIPYRFDPILSGRNYASYNPFPGEDIFGPGKRDSAFDDDRKSFLATPLFLDTDFWINLPVYSDHNIVGVNGALANATIWNASNTTRFFRSSSTAPAAVAEMAAIPELRITWAFTLASLGRWQYIGGPSFNSLYTVSEPRLWLSADPVAMDSLMLQKINRAREAHGFKPVPDDVRTLEFAETLGVGTRHPPEPVLVPVGKP